MNLSLNAMNIKVNRETQEPLDASSLLYKHLAFSVILPNQVLCRWMFMQILPEYTVDLAT